MTAKTNTTGAKATGFLPTIPFSDVKPLTEKECIAADLPSTSKSKPRLGISTHREIIWVPAHFALEDHQAILAMAKGLDRPAYELLAAVVMQWVDDHHDEIAELAADHLVGEKTETDLAKELAAMERKMASLQALLQLKKSTE